MSWCGSPAFEKSSEVKGKEVGGTARESMIWIVPPANEMSMAMAGERLLCPDVHIMIVPLCMTPPIRCPPVTLA